jgi:putative nucleotidyltransferase with HDIG domain
MDRKINTQELDLEMFVSRLDRPWLETPFPLQGFRIQSERDLELLRRYCEYVYVDTAEADPWDASTQVRKGRLSPGTPPPRDAAAPNRTAVYEETTALSEELQAAEQATQRVSALVSSVMDDVRAKKKLNLAGAEEAVGAMLESILRNPDAFLWLRRLKKKDDYTYAHSVDAAILAIAFGRHLGLPKGHLRDLATGTLLFDIGKMRLPSELLQKVGRLTDAELRLVWRHVGYGLELLEECGGVSKEVVNIVATHHERYDGSGYPRGLAGGQIPVFGQMAAIVDCYAAITSDRPYAAAVSPHDAIRHLYEWRNTDFQEDLLEQFIQALGVYPTGSVVELSTGEVGIVISQNRVRRLRPKVMVLLDRDKVAYEIAPVIDLLQESTDRHGRPMNIARALEPGSYGIRPEEFYL